MRKSLLLVPVVAVLVALPACRCPRGDRADEPAPRRVVVASRPVTHEVDVDVRRDHGPVRERDYCGDYVDR